jgi:uncharacterized membrane protein
MSGALWGIQIALAVTFLAVGLMKLVLTKEQLAPKMPGVEDQSAGVIRAIGVAEVAGAAGLLLPDLLGMLAWAAPLAATCLAVLMLGAAWTHVSRKELGPALVPLVLASLAGFVAYGRFVA